MIDCVYKYISIYRRRNSSKTLRGERTEKTVAIERSIGRERRRNMGVKFHGILFVFMMMWVSIVVDSRSVITYDGRALIIDGMRRVLFSGSIHYPRSTPEVLSLSLSLSNDIYIYKTCHALVLFFFLAKLKEEDDSGYLICKTFSCYAAYILC